MSALPALPEIPTAALSKGGRTAERILEAAETLFAKRGYAGTTLRDVAAEVGLRNPSLYNHFPSKESLYAAVLERGISPMLEALSAFAESERQDSTAVIRRMLELLAQRPNLAQLIQHEILAGGERMNPLLREWVEPVFAQARRAIERNPAASRWRPDQIPLLVLALYHVVVGYFTIAPLYKTLNGEDLLSEQALEKQARFCGDLVGLLLSNEAS